MARHIQAVCMDVCVGDSHCGGWAFQSYPMLLVQAALHISLDELISPNLYSPISTTITIVIIKINIAT